MTVLLPAEQVARASQLEIQGRDAKPGAQFAEFPDRRKPATRDWGQSLIRRNQKVCVSTPVRSSNPAAQLIELRKAITICSVDDQSICERDIQAIFDNRRRDENIELVM